VKEWRGCSGNGGGGEEKGDGRVGLWVVEGAQHNPAFNSAWSDDMLRFVLE